MAEDELAGEGGNPISQRHLLGLILEIRNLKDDAAARKLGVSIQQIREWASELEKEGWVIISSDDGVMQSYSVTKGGLGKLKSLKKQITEQENYVPKPVVPPKARMAESRARFKSRIDAYGNLVKSSYRDFILLASTLISVYLLYVFITKPNNEVLSFFLAVLIFSVVLLLFNQYDRYLKTKKVISFIEWLMWVIGSRKRYVAIIITYILMIYFVVMFIVYPADRAAYLTYSIVVISTSVLISAPKKNVMDVIKFYIGIIFLTYSVLLIVGLRSITITLLEESSRIVDVIVGVVILLLVQLNDENLGVGVNSLKKILKESDL